MYPVLRSKMSFYKVDFHRPFLLTSGENFYPNDFHYPESRKINKTEQEMRKSFHIWKYLLFEFQKYGLRFVIKVSKNHRVRFFKLAAGVE